MPETDASTLRARETALQRAATAWVATGLTFLVLPGTFLGVWNLLAISGAQSAGRVPAAWIQAHGHAQIFGWIGSFILGIGFYSLSKMAKLGPPAAGRAWVSWALWTAGVSMRWYAGVSGWHWRALLPASAALELAAFLIFALTVSGRHRRPEAATPGRQPVWVRVVMASTLGFFLSLAANLLFAIRVAVVAAVPAIPHAPDQRVLALFIWGFPVLAVWGFNARWLPVFLGLPNPRERLLLSAVGVDAAGVAAALAGSWVAFGTLVIAAAVIAAIALNLFRTSIQPPKISGVHATFPLFVRTAYVWLLSGAALTFAAALWDRAGGLWGASRHALTVGFLATMVFAIGQRILPAFCGMRLLFSTNAMFASLALLNAGCVLRVSSEVLAYEGYVPGAWPLLPASAVIELAAVTVFAANLGLSLVGTPPHQRALTAS